MEGIEAGTRPGQYDVKQPEGKDAVGKYTLDSALDRLSDVVNFVEIRVGDLVAKTGKIATSELDSPADPSMVQGGSEHVQTIGRLAERLNEVDNRIIRLLERLELN